MVSRDFLDILSACLGQPLEMPEAASGGCINAAFSARCGAGRVFVKIGPAERLVNFRAEADGLAALAAAGSHRVPTVLGLGEAEGKSFLALEWLELAPVSGREAGVAFGRALAELHRHRPSSPAPLPQRGEGGVESRCATAIGLGECYGWPTDNFIGATPQENGLADFWPRFYAEKRLKPQFALAHRNGAPKDFLLDGERLMELVPAFFLDYRPAPSLLHGDLWSGNAGMAGGRPALFDPAVHYGDREADLAMTELFGGFPEAFYAAYRDAWPLSADFELRKPLYNLYHVLNHFNLFGAGYLNQAKRMTARLLAEVRR